MSLREIARQAGVSVTTVSRIVNNVETRKVSDDTRQRVLDIARAMRYRPNQSAVSLVRKRAPQTLGLVLPFESGFFRSYFFSSACWAVLNVAGAAGLDVNLLVSRDAAGEGATEFIAGNRAAGVIVFGNDLNDDVISLCRQMQVPCVVINKSVVMRGVDTVDSDNYGGSREATRRLIRLGHRDIAFIAGPAGLLDGEERRQGYRHALEEAGISPVADWEEPGNYSEKGGREAMRALLARGVRPTAIVAANDLSAIGAMQALRRSGLRVPDDVAVIGFDDIPLAPYTEPPLTTVHQSVYRLGETAAKVLLRRIREGDDAGYAHHVVRTRLVVRESCGGRNARHIGAPGAPAS